MGGMEGGRRRRRSRLEEAHEVVVDGTDDGEWEPVALVEEHAQEVGRRTAVGHRWPEEERRGTHSTAGTWWAVLRNEQERTWEGMCPALYEQQLSSGSCLIPYWANPWRRMEESEEDKAWCLRRSHALLGLSVLYLSRLRLGAD